MKKALLYFHTIRHLKLKQLYYQVYYRLRKATPKSLKAVSVREWHGVWDSPLINNELWDGKNTFCFLNESAEIKAAKDWQDGSQSRLWFYNLHYLDCLNSIDALKHKDKLEALVLRWGEENPSLDGPGWEPYCLSLRIVNLVKWLSRQEITNPVITNKLAEQAKALESQLEYHILANHLFANGKALVFAGLFLQGEDASRWLNLGLKILEKELDEQFLADGAHFEGSPMYQGILLWDLCDLIHLAALTQHSRLLSSCDKWKQKLKRGLSWLREMSHPDGGISFFNDSSFNISASFDELCVYAREQGVTIFSESNKVTHHQESGYITLNLKNEGKLIVDVAEINPAYQPGHAHADTLSFELSLYAKRVFVNSGTSTYQDLTLRSLQRATNAHNTVIVDDKNSSEVWGGFRVARRARVDVTTLTSDADTIVISASHSGYRKLFGGILHAREYRVTENCISISDELTGRFDNAVANFYLHPEVEVTQYDEKAITLQLSNGNEVKVSFTHPVKVEDSFWYPEFGKAIANKCLKVPFLTNTLKTVIKAVPRFKAQEPSLKQK